VIAHVAGLPIEEFLPTAVAGSAALVTWMRLHLRARR
jgi:hypothetical protein